MMMFVAATMSGDGPPIRQEFWVLCRLFAICASALGCAWLLLALYKRIRSWFKKEPIEAKTKHEEGNDKNLMKIRRLAERLNINEVGRKAMKMAGRRN
ncbi:hypothetical protein RYA05_04655 [Pseudomonas syringae pv. actinidiae]|nr:hypothetical protein [Pseudomonas syringae pv. actinidiae]